LKSNIGTTKPPCRLPWGWVNRLGQYMSRYLKSGRFPVRLFMFQYKTAPKNPVTVTHCEQALTGSAGRHNAVCIHAVGRRNINCLS